MLMFLILIDFVLQILVYISVFIYALYNVYAPIFFGAIVFEP